MIVECPECGAPMAGGVEGNCPRCLMQLGKHSDPPAVQATERVGQDVLRCLGDYELLVEIARGGMGVVYRARQVSLDRPVAVKILLGGHFASAAFIQRFRREAKATAGLNHPNIVAIHEVGEHDGQPYFSMELIEGRSLAEVIREQPPTGRQAAQWLKTLAEAVHFAHERGVLHRDLKPSNVLMDAQGVPHVTDFGLAKRFDSLSPSEGDREKNAADLTLTGQLLGSPNYMPPEQADPKRGATTAASDVYSLGAILYHMLTGRPPFMAETVTQTLRLAGEGELVSPRLLNPNLSSDLETICLKCLAADSKRRYPSAHELADELGRFLNDEPIRARPISRLGRLRQWRRRKPALAASLGAGAVLLLVVAIGSPVALYRIERAREAAEAARRQEATLRVRAETAERETHAQLYTALLEQARATVLSGEMGQRIRALDAIRRAAAISNSAQLRGAAVAALALPDLRFERELRMPPNVNVARLDPTFERIAIGTGNGPIEIRSTSDYRLLATLAPSTNRPTASSGLWSRDGRFFAVSRDYQRGGGADVEVWEVTGARRALLVHTSSHNPCSFHPRLPRIIVGRAPRAAVTWDLESGQELTSQPVEGRPRLLSFAPDGETFAALHDIGQQSRLTIHSGKDGISRASHLFTNHVHEIGWHSSGHWIAVGDDKGRVLGMDARTGEIQLLGRHKSDATVLEFSPDGKYLFSGGWDLEVICWDVTSMQRAFTVALDSHHIQFRADGRQCAVARWPDVRVQLHAFERPALHREFAEDLGGPRSSAAFSRDGRWLAACGDERLVVWDLNDSDRPGAVTKGVQDTRVSFAANGELFVNPRGGGSRWSIAPGTNAAAPAELKRLDFPKLPGLFSFCLVSNGIVFTGTSGSRLAAFEQPAQTVTNWAPTTSGLSGVSPDERWLAMFRPYSPYLYVHRLPGLERVAKLTNEFRISHFAFSPASDEVAVGNNEGVEFWSTSTWQRTRHLTNFTGIVYSPDGRTFWLSTKFRAASLHLARTAEPLLPLPPNTRPLAVSPDGRLVAVTVDSRRVQVWDLAEVRERLRELALDWMQE